MAVVAARRSRERTAWPALWRTGAEILVVAVTAFAIATALSRGEVGANGEIEGFRGEIEGIRGEIEGIRAEFGQLRTGFDQRLDAMAANIARTNQWMIGLVVTLVLGLLATQLIGP